MSRNVDTVEHTPFPSFFVVGAAKAGTTTLYHYLSNHPEVFIPSKVKETNFFALEGRPADFTDVGSINYNKNSVHDEQAYAKLFESGSGKLCGEVCPLYLYSPMAAQAIARRVPDAKIIILLRDPAERAFSAYRHMQAYGSEKAKCFEDALSMEDQHIADNWQFNSHYIASSRYRQQVGRYMDAFPPENVLVIDFADIKERLDETLQEVQLFLGLSPIAIAADAKGRNKTVVISNPILRNFLVNKRFGARAIRKVIPSRYRGAIREWLIGLWREEPERMSSETHRKILEDLLEDIEGLELLLGRTFQGWSSHDIKQGG